MLNTFEVNKVLIIAPLRVARDTWPAEIEKWDHLKNLDISIVVGDVKTRIAAVHHPAMIYVVNREKVKWLVEYYEKNGFYSGLSGIQYISCTQVFPLDIYQNHLRNHFPYSSDCLLRQKFCTLIKVHLNPLRKSILRRVAPA